MRFINMPRRNGKTRLMIEAAYITGYPIIVKNAARETSVIEQARKMNYTVEVMSFETFKRNKGNQLYKKVLIDEGADFIEAALETMLGAQVVACTVTIPMRERSDIESKTEDSEGET